MARQRNRLAGSCGNFSLVGVEGTECGVYPLACKRRDCPRCGPKTVRAAIARVRLGMQLGSCRFFTITSPGSEDSATTYRELPKRWKRIHQALVRRFGPLEYVAVVEAQQRGAAHLHVVYRGPFIPQPLLSRLAARSGFGKIADIRRPTKQIARYLVKYLAKDLQRPKAGEAQVRLPRYLRRVRWTAGWCVWTKRTPDRHWSRWWITDAPPDPTAGSARRRGLTVVEIVGNDWPPGLDVRPVHWMRELAGYRPATAIPRLVLEILRSRAPQEQPA